MRYRAPECDAEPVRVLLAEDDVALADVIARGLRREAIAVDVAYDGGEALEKARAVPYDVVVLDRWLPVVHGDVVCRELCATGAGPRVLMLSAASLVNDRVVGLDLLALVCPGGRYAASLHGADDLRGDGIHFSSAGRRIVGS